MLSYVFTYFAGVIVIRPFFRNLYGNEFYNNIHRFYSFKVVREMGSYPERRLAIGGGIFLYFQSIFCVQSIAEGNLFCFWIDSEGVIFLNNLLQLLSVVSTIHA